MRGPALKVSGIDINNGVNNRKMKTCVSNARKTAEITLYFCEGVRDPLLFTRHLRCKKHTVKLLNPCCEDFTEMFVEKND